MLFGDLPLDASGGCVLDEQQSELLHLRKGFFIPHFYPPEVIKAPK